VIPGIATATEIQAALAAGLRILKFFPAALLGGPPAIRALGAVYPEVEFVPTGGITAASCAEYLAERAVLAVGGSWMVPQAAIDSRDFASIAELCRSAVSQLRDSATAPA